MARLSSTFDVVFEETVLSAAPHRLQSAGFVVVPGQHDHWHVRCHLRSVDDCVETSRVGQGQIEQCAICGGDASAAFSEGRYPFDLKFTVGRIELRLEEGGI